jgi:16S rRNA processing protein RimM
MTKEYIEMGTCFKPHGIKGELIFNLLNTEDSSLKNKLEILLKPKDSKSSLSSGGESFILESIRFGNKTIARLKDIADRNIVEAMIPFSIWIDRKDFNELDSDEVYISDLVGFHVFDDEDKKVGVVENYYDNGAQPVLVICLEDESKIELPFVPSFFPEVDSDQEKIIMINPGLY